MPKRWGLAIEGGGIRGAYAAGVIDALLENHLFADVCYGTSAGALVGSNYAAREEGRTIALMLKAMHNPRFASPLNLWLKGNVFDFSWLFYHATKRFPFDERTFHESSTDFFAVATHCETGKPIYWNKNDEEFYEGLAASCSLPLYTNKTIFVHGIPCLDGGVCERVPFHKMLLDGLENIVVVTTRPRGFRYDGIKNDEKSLQKRYKNYLNLLKANRDNYLIYNRHMEELERLEDEGRVIVVWPSRPLNISFFEFRKKKIMPLYELGKSDCYKLLDKIKKSIR